MESTVQTPNTKDAAQNAGDTDVIVSVTFTNFSSDEWTLDFNGWQGADGWAGPTQLPSNPLDAIDGQQTMAANELFSWLLQPPLNIWCCWRNPAGYRFGVFLHGQLQMFGIGARPDWYVMSDYNPPNSQPYWVKSGAQPADPYTWSDSPDEYMIIAVPDSQHSSLSLEVQINPA